MGLRDLKIHLKYITYTNKMKNFKVIEAAKLHYDVKVTLARVNLPALFILICDHVLK